MILVYGMQVPTPTPEQVDGTQSLGAGLLLTVLVLVVLGLISGIGYLSLRFQAWRATLAPPQPAPPPPAARPARASARQVPPFMVDLPGSAVTTGSPLDMVRQVYGGRLPVEPRQVAAADDLPTKPGDVAAATRQAVALLPASVTPIRPSSRRMLPLIWDGATWHGLDLEAQEHMRLCGMSGSGKGNTQQLLLLQALSLGPEQTQAWIIDCKNGIDYRHLAMRVEHARLYADEFEADEQGNATSVPLFDGTVDQGLARLVLEMNRRNRIIGDSGCVNLREYNQDHPEQPMPVILALLDEVASFTKDQQRLLEELARKARSAGIVLVVTTQYPTAQALSTQIQPNLHRSLTFRMDSDRFSAVALGIMPGTPYPYEPSALGAPGVGIWRQPGGGFILGRAPLLTPEYRRSWEREIAQRWPRNAQSRNAQSTAQSTAQSGAQSASDDDAPLAPELAGRVVSGWSPRHQELAIWLYQQRRAGRRIASDDLSYREIARWLFRENADEHRGAGKYSEMAKTMVNEVMPVVLMYEAAPESVTPPAAPTPS